MPYRDKNKEKERNKNYFKKNKALLMLKQKRRRSLTHSQATNDSLPESLPVPIPNNSLNRFDELRAKIKDIESRVHTSKSEPTDFVDDVVTEPVYE